MKLWGYMNKQSREFKSAALGKVAQVRSGYSFSSNDFGEIGTPVIRISDIFEGRISAEGAVKTTLPISDSHFILDCNDFAIAMSGATTGKIGIYYGSKAFVNQRVGKFIVTDSATIDKEYLYHFVSSLYFSNQLSEVLEQGAQPNISSRLLETFKISFPVDLNEQKTIAKALSDIDKLIENLELEISKCKNLFRSTMQKLILPNYIDAELPKGWKLLSLGNLGTISGAGVDKVSRSEEIPIKLLNYMDVYKNDFISNNVKFMNTTATKDQVIKCSLKKGDVLFTPTSETPEDIAQSSVVFEDLDLICYSYHLVRFRPSFELDSNYLAYVFSVEDFRKQARKAAEGSGTRYVITLPRFRNLLIPVPSLSLQVEIGSVLRDIALRIESLITEKTKYVCIKQGMAHDLLTGKVRLA